MHGRDLRCVPIHRRAHDPLHAHVQVPPTLDPRHDAPSLRDDLDHDVHATPNVVVPFVLAVVLSTVDQSHVDSNIAHCIHSVTSSEDSALCNVHDSGDDTSTPGSSSNCSHSTHNNRQDLSDTTPQPQHVVVLSPVDEHGHIDSSTRHCTRSVANSEDSALCNVHDSGYDTSTPGSSSNFPHSTHSNIPCPFDTTPPLLVVLRRQGPLPLEEAEAGEEVGVEEVAVAVVLRVSEEPGRSRDDAQCAVSPSDVSQSQEGQE